MSILSQVIKPEHERVFPQSWESDDEEGREPKFPSLARPCSGRSAPVRLRAAAGNHHFPLPAVLFCFRNFHVVKGKSGVCGGLCSTHWGLRLACVMSVFLGMM